ncbi:hypothetical protein PINS_up013518 [Pythium insidiosum]|nr:hypothetical protein PINS_up013518 [Pythium insidiosum]
MSLEKPTDDGVAVTLFPVDYETVEMVTDQGQEVLQQDFSEAQLFMHSIQELERVRGEHLKTKRRKTTSAAAATSTATTITAAAEKPSDESAVAVKVENGVASTEDVDMEAGGDDVKMEQEASGGDSAGDAAPTSADTVEGEEEEHETEEEEVIDPRIHYRPMVAELQASIIELNQLINTIELIRQRQFLEDMHCRRENTMETKEDLDYLVESKTQQLKESSRILLAGVDALTTTVEKESVFFDGVTQLLKRWKLCAPIHGNIPKPFRAGEPLAVDCSFVSAGSTFQPPTRTITDLSFAELSRTEKGLVCIKAPEDYLLRTIQVKLRHNSSGTEGSFTLPAPKVKTLSKATMDRLENTPEDVKVLDERNVSVLKAVQFSVFCEELFYTVMQEALWTANQWSDSAMSAKRPPVKKPSKQDDGGVSGPVNISVVDVLDDEVRLRLRDQYDLTIKLLDASAKPIEPMSDSNGRDPATYQNGTVNGSSGVETTGFNHTDTSRRREFLQSTCRFVLLQLQQEVRNRHGRTEIGRGMLFDETDQSTGSSSTVSSGASSFQQEIEKADSLGPLATVVSVVAHNLLKEETSRYLDTLSSKLAFQRSQASASGRILEDGLNQPICDSVRGVYVTPRWKVCPYDATLTAFDLSIGKSFSTEIVISGTKIRFEDGPGTVREVSSLSVLIQFIEKTVCSQVALALQHDLLSFGFKQATIDLDRASVRLFAAGEWDGSSIGDGRVPDSKPVACVFFEPYITADMTVSINCLLQAVPMAGVEALLGSQKNGKTNPLVQVDWQRIPGSSDVAKVAWLLQKTIGLPQYFGRSSNLGGQSVK